MPCSRRIRARPVRLQLLALGLLALGACCPPERGPNVAAAHAAQFDAVVQAYRYVLGKPAPPLTLADVYVQEVPIARVQDDCDQQAMGCTCDGALACADLITLPDAPVPIVDAQGRQVGEHALPELATHEFTHLVIDASGCDSHDHGCNFWDVFDRAMKTQGLSYPSER